VVVVVVVVVAWGGPGWGVVGVKGTGGDAAGAETVTREAASFHASHGRRVP
jgi:hypothetical protein